MKTDILIHDYNSVVRTDGYGRIIAIYATKPRMRWMKKHDIDRVNENYELLEFRLEEFEHKPIES